MDSVLDTCPAPECNLTPRDVSGLLDHFAAYHAHFGTAFARSEQSEHSEMYLRGLLSSCERKSIEPMALHLGVATRPLQHLLQNDGVAGSLDEPGTPGWFIHPKVVPESGEVVLRKVRDDGFDGTVLEDLLAHKGVTRIAVAGLLSEMCVSATVRGALVRGFQVVLVHDAHATYDLDDIPASIVARVAEHALGDEVELADAISVVFGRPSQCSTKRTRTERGFGSTRSKLNDR